MIGIYKITNKINGKCYIGQSINITNRWKRHKNTAYNPNNESYDSPLYQSFRKYGIENFSFEILEECSKELLNSKERYWIQYYNSYNNGYNQTDGGSEKFWSGKLSKKQVVEICELLKTGNLTQQEIANKYNTSQQIVDLINRGISYVLEGYTYPIRNYHKKIAYCIDCGKELQHNTSIRCQECSFEYQRKKTEYYYIEQGYPTRQELKELIRKESFVSISKTYNVTDNAVRRWCDHYKLPRTKREITTYSDEEWEKL